MATSRTPAPSPSVNKANRTKGTAPDGNDSTVRSVKQLTGVMFFVCSSTMTASHRNNPTATGVWITASSPDRVVSLPPHSIPRPNPAQRPAAHVVPPDDRPDRSIFSQYLADQLAAARH